MFANACEKASSFTRPVIVSQRFFDGGVECGCGAFVVLNNEGWIVTVEHLWRSFLASLSHRSAIDSYNLERKKIDDDQHLDARKKHKRFSRLTRNDKWITNHSFWWGKDGVNLQDIRSLPEADLVVARLIPFDASAIQHYPKIKDPNSMRSGTSLCKLGYPFHEIRASYDESNNAFQLEPGSLPLPRFPIEGIHTRNILSGKSKDGRFNIKFLETSSPGLRGQSGGPIFDSNGSIWAIQSRTNHLPLGFSPKIKKDGKEVVEHQFLNVGVGIHAELLLAFLSEHKIAFETDS